MLTRSHRAPACTGMLVLVHVVVALLLVAPAFDTSGALALVVDEGGHDPRVVTLPASLDSSGTKIADALEAMARATGDGLLDVIVGFTRSPGAADRAWFQATGCTWKDTFTTIHAARVLVPATMLGTVAGLRQVSFVSGNARSRAMLYLSNPQIHARGGAWNHQVAGTNITGMQHVSTAVLDTGIDGNHPDLAGQLVAWKDFAGVNASIDGDEYDTFSDFDHHGTHVAGIIAGQGNASSSGHVNVTHAGVIAHDEGQAWQGPAFVKHDAVPGTVTIKQSWNESIGSFVGLKKDGSWLGQGVVSNDTGWSIEIDAPGEYRAMVGGNDHGVIVHDVPFVSQVSFPVTAPADGHGAITGIAPGSKIAGVKVLDDTGRGTSAQLLAAYDWCVAHKETYNITVINLSLGFDEIIPAIDVATANLVKEHGFIVVASAGNDGPSASMITSPGSTPEAITVGAVNRLNQVASYSSTGSPEHNDVVVKPDVTAPGGSVTTHQVISVDSNFDDQFDGIHGDGGWIDETEASDRFPNDYTGMHGTSMAAPHVSGLAQLVIQHMALAGGGGWDWSPHAARTVKQVICMATAESAALEPGGEGEQAPSLERGSKDFTEGWGLVDAAAAVTMLAGTQGPLDTVLHLSDEPGGRRVFGFGVDLVMHAEYTFSLIPGDADLDLDMFIYSNTPTVHGEPVELARSTMAGPGIEQHLSFNTTDSGTHFLVVRWAGGAGAGNATLNVSSRSVPGQVTGLETTPGYQSVNLTWDAPGDDGSSPLTGYRVYRSADEGGEYLFIGTNTTVTGFVDAGLDNGMGHFYAVSAMNEAGEGARSDPVFARTWSVPGQVTGLVATPGNGTVSLAWGPPLDGGTPVTWYNILRSSSEGGVYLLVGTNTTTTGFIDDGLDDGETFFYAVSATNVVGEGERSTPVEARTWSVPGQVTGLVATPGNGTVSLAWDPPWDGGTPVTGYVVHWSLDNETFDSIMIGNVTTYLHEGLEAGTTWYYTVAAVNVMGTGRNASTVQARTWSVPGQVAGLVATSGNGTVSLAWDPPWDGGTPVTGYVVHWSLDNETFDSILIGNVMTYLHEELQNGQGYHYMVAAINVMGTGMNSSTVVSIPVAPPSRPATLVATGGRQVVSLAWDPPATTGGFPVIAYNIYRDGTLIHSTATGVILAYNDTGRENGTTYTYSVSAVTVAGEGASSLAAEARTWSVPGQVTGLVATIVNDSVALSWNVAVDGGTPVIAYRVYQDGTLIHSTGPGVTAWVDTTALDGHTRVYTVSAVNVMGEGLHSQDVHVTPSMVPPLENYVVVLALGGAGLAVVASVLAKRGKN